MSIRSRYMGEGLTPEEGDMLNKAEKCYELYNKHSKIAEEYLHEAMTTEIALALSVKERS